MCRRHFPVRVNIIEYNLIDGRHTKTGEERPMHFSRRIWPKWWTVTVRRSDVGKDIDAACGSWRQ
ncbi:MAG: hypothetical protein H6569_03370 [Lewinellaceae bacterium]|nr:hypothetical protein [Lewinellaceae bacterium]